VQDQLRAALQDSLAAKDEEINALSMQVECWGLSGRGTQTAAHLVLCSCAAVRVEEEEE
jgi:hypothetical protein